MEAPEFKDFAKTMVDFIAEYLENIRERWARFRLPTQLAWIKLNLAYKFHLYGIRISRLTSAFYVRIESSFCSIRIPGQVNDISHTFWD